MSDPNSSGGQSALRALHAAADEVASLRSGGLDADQARGCILRIANSVDRTLRRLLRDDERAPLATRLQALAPDEIAGDEVLAELRRNDRLQVHTAAAVHELLQTRRRLERGGLPEPGDPQRAIVAFERLQPEVERAPPPAYVASSPLPGAELDETVVGASPKAPRRSARSSGVPAWAIGAGAALILVVAIGAWLMSDRGPTQLDQGIALFRSGAYADAAHHFWRFAEANPDDVTPHLYLARIHRRMDRPELAAESLREAQRLAPEDAAVHRELGFLLLDTGRADVAVERFRTAIEMEPESSEGWVGLVRALRESGREAEVSAVMEEAPAEVRALLNSPDPD
ncbi:MAG: tetratricopeptide repeat protein [Gemmatimonadota bacterium]